VSSWWAKGPPGPFSPWSPAPELSPRPVAADASEPVELGRCPADLARLACHRGPGPHSSLAVGRSDPGEKSSCAVNYFQKFQTLVQTCKMHILFSVCQKNTHDISKCSEKWDLHFSIKIMHW
jgi:hypothetical protein